MSLRCIVHQYTTSILRNVLSFRIIEQGAYLIDEMRAKGNLQKK